MFPNNGEKASLYLQEKIKSISQGKKKCIWHSVNEIYCRKQRVTLEKIINMENDH